MADTPRLPDRWRAPRTYVLPQRRAMRVLRRGVWTVCWSAIALASGPAVGRQMEVTSELGVTAVVLAPYAAFAAVVAEIGLLSLRRSRSAMSGALMVALVAAAQLPAFIPARRPPSDMGLTVMTSNIRLGLADPDAVVALVALHQVDVLAIQELTGPAVSRLHKSGLDRLMPYRVISPREAGAGVGIWSRLPLTDTAVLDGFGFDPLRAQLNVSGRVFTFVCFHSKAPLYNGGTEQWMSDLRRLAQAMIGMPAPVLVAGDFNATRDHKQFRDLLSNGFNDAADDAGAGVLPTYPADRSLGPIASLDHVVLSPDLVGVRVQTAKVGGSDHRAVIARVSMVSS